VVGHKTEAAFVSGGGVPFRLFGTGLPGQVGTPGNWAARCAGVSANCAAMTPAEQARVFPKGGTPQGTLQDRTPESAREVKLQLHLSDYDVNDWLVRKPAHRAGLDQVIAFIKADPSKEPVEVTITGSASRQGDREINEQLACKRAQCAGAYIRAGLVGHPAEGRVTIDSSGNGFDEATCDPLPGGGTACELPRYRSVLVQVHAPGRKPTRIPVMPRTTFTIQCLRYERKTATELIGKTIGDALEGLLKDVLPQGLIDELEKRLEKLTRGLASKLIGRLKKHIKFGSLVKRLEFVFRKIPLQFIRETAAFRIAERVRPLPLESTTLCYVGVGIRVEVPLRALAKDILDLVLPKELRDRMGPLTKPLLDFIEEQLGSVVSPLVSAGPGAVKPFDTDRDTVLKDFAGRAMMGKDFLSPGRVHLGFRAVPFTRPLSPIIPVPVGPGTREIFAVTEGTLTVANCTAGGGEDRARRFAAPRRLAIPGRLAQP
jgi:hypothetical protein